MKYFAIIVVVAFAASVQAEGLGDKQKEQLKAYAVECIASTGVNKDLVLKAREKGEFTEDSKLELYYLCMFKKVKFINDAGEMQEDVVRSKIPASADKTKAEAVIQKCKTHKGDTPQRTAYLMFKCYKENASFSLL